MGYASIMVYVDDVDSANSRIALACDVAELFKAELIGVSASLPIRPVIGPYPVGVVMSNAWIEEEKLAEKEVKRAEGRFRSIAGARRSHLVWRAGVCDPAELVARQARKADVIILGPDSGWPRSCNAANPGDVLMAAGRPVFVSPPNSALKPMLAHVLIAWKDCREARRAVADSLPLLGKADKITIMEIAEEAEQTRNHQSVEDVADFIRLHGKSATALAISSNGQSIAEQLLAYADANGVGLIVLGGYGHARTREWIFGGVTRTLLETSPICCLFSH
jgi:nucleotide-binding universal stress UspA family protein